MTELDRLYRARFESAGLAKRNRVWQILCAEFFNRYVRPQDTVLDLACGYGEFINNIPAARKFAIDLNPDAPGYLRPEVTFEQTSAERLEFLPPGSLDVVFASNFLEHLPSKEVCSAVFASVQERLKPGGRFVIMGPNIRYAFREYWDFYDHLLPLSHLSLVEGLELAGYETEAVIPRFLPYTMNSRLPTMDVLIRAYLAIPLAWRVLGKQFLVVARRPG